MTVLSPTGLVIPRQPEIESDLVANYQTNIHPNINTSDDTFLGQNKQILAEAISKAYEVLEWANNQRAISTAEGKFLDDFGLQKGVSRLQATSSTLNVAIEGVDETFLPSGRLVEDPSTGVRFISSEDTRINNTKAIKVVLAPSVAALSTAYTVRVNGVDYTQNSGAGPLNMATTMAALASAIDAGTTGLTVTSSATSLTITSTDNTLEFSAVPQANMTLGTVTSLLSVKSLVEGSATIPTPSTAYRIITPVIGWNKTYPIMTSVINGRDRESDVVYRARIISSAVVGGKATMTAIRNALLNTSGVSYATVIENDTDVTVDSIPPYGIHCIVEGGTNLAIAGVIWETKGATTKTSGAITQAYTDGFGELRTVKFSRPTELSVDVEVSYSLYSEEPASVDIDDKITDAVVEYVNGLGLGLDVVATKIIPPLYKAVSGVIINSVRVKLSSSPTWLTTKVTIPSASFASTISSNVSIIIV